MSPGPEGGVISPLIFALGYAADIYIGVPDKCIDTVRQWRGRNKLTVSPKNTVLLIFMRRTAWNLAETSRPRWCQFTVDSCYISS